VPPPVEKKAEPTSAAAKKGKHDAGAAAGTGSKLDSKRAARATAGVKPARTRPGSAARVATATDAAAARWREQLEPYLASARGLPTGNNGPRRLNREGVAQLSTALRRADVERVRLLLHAAPSREVLESIAAEAKVDLAGTSECARLLRSAFQREELLEEEERIGKRAASAAVMRAGQKKGHGGGRGQAEAHATGAK
jgi:hypothetical protein